MISIAAHLIQAVLDAEYVACSDARRSRHVQVIRLLAKGNGISQVSVITAYGERWIEQLRARYNAGGAETLGDLRRGNGTTATILTEAILAKLRERLKTPPPPQTPPLWALLLRGWAARPEARPGSAVSVWSQ